MKRRLIGPTLGVLAMVAVGLGLAPSPASAFHEATVHLEAGAWFPSLEAEVHASRLGVTGDQVTEGDLGIDDPDVVLNGTFDGRVTGPYASLSLEF